MYICAQNLVAIMCILHVVCFGFSHLSMFMFTMIHTNFCLFATLFMSSFVIKFCHNNVEIKFFLLKSNNQFLSLLSFRKPKKDIVATNIK